MIKDKRKLKNYLSCTYNELERNCYKIDKYYVISDKYSIICLNDSNELNIIKENDTNAMYKSIKGFYEDFNNTTQKNEITPDYSTEAIKIDKDYSIATKNLKEIKNLIKADKFFIREHGGYLKYIIEIRNTKTNEYAYLLPCRVY
jgi:hypothetical protein